MKTRRSLQISCMRVDAGLCFVTKIKYVIVDLNVGVRKTNIIKAEICKNQIAGIASLA